MVITLRDAAKMLDVPRKTVEKWIKDGKIPCHRIGEQFVFERLDLFEFAVAENLNPVPILADYTGDEKHHSFYDSLLRGGITHHVAGTTKKEALFNALSSIKGLENKAVEPLFELFMAREEIASTGVGDGIAIPHARGPIIGYVSAPLLSLSFLEHPVEFGALDGKPVSVLFLIVSPTVRMHLHILGKLAYALQTPACREAVLRQAPPDTILKLFREIDTRFRETNADNQ